MFDRQFSRREALRTASCGFGAVALASMQAKAADDVGGEASAAPRGSLVPKPPHFAPRAKRVIFLFMSGGPSQVDTFDYKPELQRRDGQPVPESFRSAGSKVQDGDRLVGSPWKFAPHGRSGLWISELFPHLAGQADELCLLNGMHCDAPGHGPACQQLHTGSTSFVRPSVGAWTLYGLGTENDSLPGYVTVGRLGRGGEARNRGSAFLPAACQGTPLGGGTIAHLHGDRFPRSVQAERMQALRALDRELQTRTGADPQLDGTIESYELAVRMQSVAPDVFDLSRETAETQALYGVDRGDADEVGRSCLLARRLAEAGVRFIEVGCGGSWDHHARLRDEAPAIARRNDRPIAGLLADLKRRGLLHDTLVVWGGEFGRLPANGNSDGRDHDNHGYTMWLAGGGAKGGLRHGSTDEFGFAAVAGRVHLHDLHATILHLLGLDHRRLTRRHSGRDFRLTDVAGRVVEEILA